MGRPGLTDYDSYRWPLLVGHRDRDGEEVHCFSSPGPWLVEALFPGPSGSSAGPRLGKLEGLQEKACNLPLTSLSTWWPPPHRPLTELLPQWSRIDSYRWAGSSSALTNSLAGHYMLLIDSWLLVGRAGAWGTEQWLNKTCCLVTGCKVMRHSNARC